MEKTLTRNGVTLFYEVLGSGPTLLLSHGFGASAAMWAPQRAVLSEHYQLILWDMRGHARSDSPDAESAYSEAETVADMAAILDAEGVSGALIGGLSLGGYMSLAFACTYPERVRGLLLFDTGPGYKQDAAREKWNGFARRQAEKYETRGLDAAPKGPETAGASHRSARGLAQAARGMLAQVDARVIESLSAVSVPTLVLVGAEDAPYLAAANYMAEKIPQGELVVVPDAGHAANLDQPDAFNRAVLGFLAAHFSPAQGL
ncbi:MAG: alpha/beta fold hydrolase [Pseudomonadales bacterium]|nr:alpha/beta fold hydrolase [Pseudomonadales bacterium]